MKEKKTKRVIVRLTENQFKSLMDYVAEEKTTKSRVLRETIKRHLIEYINDKG